MSHQGAGRSRRAVGTAIVAGVLAGAIALALALTRPWAVEGPVVGTMPVVTFERAIGDARALNESGLRSTGAFSFAKGVAEARLLNAPSVLNGGGDGRRFAERIAQTRALNQPGPDGRTSSLMERVMDARTLNR